MQFVLREHATFGVKGDATEFDRNDCNAMFTLENYGDHNRRFFLVVFSHGRFFIPVAITVRLERLYNKYFSRFSSGDKI